MGQGKGGPICAGAYTRSKACVKEKVGLSARGLIRGGIIGGEIRYMF